MTKAELDLLENIFSAEIEGRLYQTKSKVAKKLENDGLIMMDSKVLGKDHFGIIEVSGYRLTFEGNFTYCMSERCK